MKDDLVNGSIMAVGSWGLSALLATDVLENIRDSLPVRKANLVGSYVKLALALRLPWNLIIDCIIGGGCFNSLRFCRQMSE